MPDRSGSPRSNRDERCAVCGGKFGLIRHYSWRTPLCSAKCVDRLRARRANDGIWLLNFRIALVQTPKHRARAS
jgi:hypothetical protein